MVKIHFKLRKYFWDKNPRYDSMYGGVLVLVSVSDDVTACLFWSAMMDCECSVLGNMLQFDIVSVPNMQVQDTGKDNKWVRNILW